MTEFYPFRLDVINQCLWRRGDGAAERRIPLPPKAFAMLRYLVEHAGRLVTQDELLDALWPDASVQPEVLKSHIRDIRTVLCDNPKAPRFIETLPRRGYQFIAPVSESSRDTLLQTGPITDNLVGRDSELAQLGEHLKSALHHDRQLVFVTGEAGIGKTSLVDAFQRQAAANNPGLRIARGQCVEGYGGREPYYPMLEALSQLCRDAESVVQALAEHAPTWLVQFPALVKREHREHLHREIVGATRERMLREIADALEAITAKSPLLLVFEDVQWVDPATVDLISVLARRRQPASLLLVVTDRPVDVPLADNPLKSLKQDLLVHGLCDEISLEPLDKTDVANYLVAQCSGTPLPQGLAALIHRHSEGNPLFMVAMLAHMQDRGLITLENGSWRLGVPLRKIELEVPETLRRMIEIEIERLPPEEQQVLQAASVTGVSFSARVNAVAANFDEEAFEEICEDLSRRRQMVRRAGTLQFPDGSISQRYEFSHGSYREVFYNRMAAGNRAKVHQLIAERLEELYSGHEAAVAAELAQHFEQAFDWQRAIKYFNIAAYSAKQRYANREAIATLQHALELLPKLPESEQAAAEAGILERLTRIYVVDIDDRAIPICQTLIDVAARGGLIDAQVQALINLAFVLSWSSSQRALEALDRALELSDKQSPAMRLNTRMNCYGWRIFIAGWTAEDMKQFQSAFAQVRRRADPETFALHLMEYSAVQGVCSQYRESYTNALESLALIFAGNQDYTYINRVYAMGRTIVPWSLLSAGDWGEALREIEAGITSMEKNDNPYRVRLSRLTRAFLHLQAMDLAGAHTVAEAELRSFQSVLNRSGTSHAYICHIILGFTETSLGNHERALDHLRQAADHLDREMIIRSWYWRIAVQSGLTDLWLARGDLDRARFHAELFLNKSLASEERTWQALAWEANARVAAAECDVVRAQEFIASAISTMEGFEVPLAAWRVHATASEIFERMQKRDQAMRHRELSRATIEKLADSLPDENTLRKIFLSAPAIRTILGEPKVYAAAD